MPEPPQWPPRSPYEAVLTSPSGRQKLERHQSRLSPSPSPLKKSATTPNLRQTGKNLAEQPLPESEDEEEDEETLQLRLQALEAKLKLKKLRAKKAKSTAAVSTSDTENIDRRCASRVGSVLSSRRAPRGEPVLARSRSTADVQIPVSPEKQRTVAQLPTSPGRVLLGIDKGLSGRNVSLRRAPSLRTPARADENPFGGNLKSIDIRSGGTLSRRTEGTQDLGQPAGKSFNERIVASRDQERQEKERRDRVEQLRRQRSTGFGVEQARMESFKKASVEEQEQSNSSRRRQDETNFSREEVLRGLNKPVGGLVQRSKTVSSVRNTRREESASTTPDLFSRPKSAAVERKVNREKLASQPSVELSDGIDRSGTADSDPTLFETFSSINLSRRILPHTFLERTLEGKNPTVLPDLLSKVIAPEFSLPEELECGDFVLFAIIASKSPPLSHKDTHQTQNSGKDATTSTSEAVASEENERGKYMVFTLTDLKWTLDLFLFTTAYTRFRKLTPGTLIAILNPTVMPPPRHKADTGRWSLTLNSSDDTILEIGTAKDLSWCKATKKDGHPCSDWIDARKTEFCEFHVDRNVERARRGRMEVQGMSAPFAPGGKRGGRSGFFGSDRSKAGGGSKEKDDGLKPEGKQYDRGAHTTYFIAPGRTAASLLDADEDGGRGSRVERMQKALAERERERDIARRLGSGGSGAGAEYLRLKQGESSAGTRGNGQGENVEREAKSAKSLGLKENAARDVMLSPLKRKRSVVGGGAKKKTRFVTANGIREAGRESLGGAPGGLDDGDDDGLDIV